MSVLWKKTENNLHNPMTSPSTHNDNGAHRPVGLCAPLSPTHLETMRKKQKRQTNKHTNKNAQRYVTVSHTVRNNKMLPIDTKLNYGLFINS